MIVPCIFRRKGRNGYDTLFRNNPDIDEYVEFEIYDYCWYWDSPQGFPHNNKRVGRWLISAHRVFQSMVYYVVCNNGEGIYRSTVSPIDSLYYDVRQKRFDSKIWIIPSREKLMITEMP